MQCVCVHRSNAILSPHTCIHNNVLFALHPFISIFTSQYSIDHCNIIIVLYFCTFVYRTRMTAYHPPITIAVISVTDLYYDIFYRTPCIDVNVKATPEM